MLIWLRHWPIMVSLASLFIYYHCFTSLVIIWLLFDTFHTMPLLADWLAISWLHYRHTTDWLPPFASATPYRPSVTDTSFAGRLHTVTISPMPRHYASVTSIFSHLHAVVIRLPNTFCHHHHWSRRSPELISPIPLVTVYFHCLPLREGLITPLVGIPRHRCRHVQYCYPAFLPYAAIGWLLYWVLNSSRSPPY